MKKRLLVSAGPIPAKLDSVKFITNKFRGGLAMHVARMLSAYEEFEVHVVATDSVDTRGISLYNVHIVKDILEYGEFIREFEADSYILCAAVANLMPVKPWKGKFPSHKYSEGKEFNIKFKLAPRIIDRVREWHPRTTLIGYKLFDGKVAELVEAGEEVMRGSLSHLVFCNHPDRAAYEKIVITPEGGAFGVSFDDHVRLMADALRANWYSSVILEEKESTIEVSADELQLLWKLVDKMGHGTFATMRNGRMLTTRRKKSQKNLSEAFCEVKAVDVKERRIHVHRKATINAPALWEVLYRKGGQGVLVHGHQNIECGSQVRYIPPGTDAEVSVLSRAFESSDDVRVVGHGYYKWFQSMTDAVNFSKTL